MTSVNRPLEPSTRSEKLHSFRDRGSSFRRPAHTAKPEERWTITAGRPMSTGRRYLVLLYETAASALTASWLASASESAS